jgi:hypothetical protein
MVALVETPTFGRKKVLARWIPPDARLRNKRPAFSAFLEPVSDPSKDHLSVNSLEVERLKHIADYYRLALQNGGDVSICTNTVEDYIEAGKKSGAQISYNTATRSWEFGNGTSRSAAFRARPVRRSSGPHSPSHCGVEFIQVMDDHRRSQLARRLAVRRFHVY